jgi:TRAP-type C4-dicarboxylate transport system permease small subunit
VETSPLWYAILGVIIILLAVLRSWLIRRDHLGGLFRILGHCEVAMLALLLGTLIGLGCLQIILRNLFQSGLLWADPLMRHIVLWLGCLGAALATTRVRHINIDVFTRLLPPAFRPLRRAIVYTATAVAAFVLGVAAWRLVVDERAFGEAAFGPFQVWMLQTVLPFAFFLISYRSIVNLLIAREPLPADGTMESLEQ